MKKTTTIRLLLCMLMISMLSACGGGSSSVSVVKQPTSATLTLSTTITGTIPNTTTIASYVVTVTLPTGVTVMTMPTSSATGTGVVVASGKALGALISGVYTAASGTVPGKVVIGVVRTGIDAGEFCIVKGDVAPGYFPTASSFVMPTLDEATGSVIATGTSEPGLEAELSLSAAVAIQ
jgi:hypothetical protein